MNQLTILSMSGGLDSATLCAEALSAGYDVYVINFDYGQKNIVETIAFNNIINNYKQRNDFKGRIIGIKKINLKTVLDEFTELWQEMRDNGSLEKEAHHQFYMPSRNLLFAVLSTVAGEIIALNKNYKTVNIGLGIHKHSEDAYGAEHRDYWDITPQFAEKLQKLLSLNDVVNIKIFSPFVDKTKTDVVERAVELKVPIELTWTCYNPSIKEGIAIPCLVCEACKERELAGKLAGVENINNYHVIIE